MHVITLLQTTAYMPNLATRPFLAAFVVACLALTDLQSSPQSIWGFQAVPAAPAWFTSPPMLLFLGFLAAAEILARKDPDIQLLLREVDGLFKSVVTLIVTFALLDPESAMLLSLMAGGVEPLTFTSLAWSGAMTVGTLGASTVRNGFFGWLQELDEGDDLGLQGVLSWLEDLGVGFGVVLATFLPIIAITLFGLTLLSLWLLQIYIDHREAANREPCHHCQQPIRPAALICHHCGHNHPAPLQIGIFGQTKSQLVEDVAKHHLSLLARKRCPTCATRLPERTLRQTCPTCQTITFADGIAFDLYLSALRPTLTRSLLICFGVGFVPLVGLILGVIYYRLSLIASLRQYVPRHTGCLVRWGVRILNIGLVALQPIPFLGALTLPLMCYVNYTVYQQVLLRESERVFTQPSAPSPPLGPGEVQQAEGVRTKV